MAVIDIGTNTCHLLIGRIVKSRNHVLNLHTLLKKRHYTYLAEKGLSHIGSGPQKRLFDALYDFSDIIKSHNVWHVKIIATEGLRKASNGSGIQHQIQQKLGWPVNVISGAQEADYLFTAIKSGLNIQTGQHLIVDIGGGSTEFILTEHGRVIKSKSLPLGIARLHNSFQKSDPITKSETRDIEDHIISLLEGFISYANSQLTLVGMAGTFEIFEEQLPLLQIDRYNSYIDLTIAQGFIQEIVTLDLEKRKAHPAVPDVRATYVVVALILISALLKIFSPKKFIVSKFSIKEGVVFDEFEKSIK